MSDQTLPSTSQPEESDAPEPQLLTEPADGVPEVVDTAAGLSAMVESLAAGRGPIALDTERAQSYRYSAKAYLIQLRREGAGSFILDPIAFEDRSGVTQLGALQEVLGPTEWILHAATQDLPCLVMAGLRPSSLYDTELAGRLLGLPRVGLGALVEHYFGMRLLKEHSAANWSTRPIPHDWLVYAALDVELLIGMRELQLAELEQAGKAEWARQEFAHLVDHAGDSAERDDSERWRRTHGLNQVKTTAGMALVRELWDERDLLAERYDQAPAKVVQDRAITELASLISSTDARANPPVLPSRNTLRGIDGFKRRTARRFENNWIGAIDRVAALPRSEWPARHVAADGPPHPRNWDRVEPEAAARWELVRPAINELAEDLGLPPENLLSPDALRRITWQPPALDEASLGSALADRGVRAWQIALVVPVLLAQFEAAAGDDEV